MVHQIKFGVPHTKWSDLRCFTHHNDLKVEINELHIQPISLYIVLAIILSSLAALLPPLSSTTTHHPNHHRRHPRPNHHNYSATTLQPLSLPRLSSSNFFLSHPLLQNGSTVYWDLTSNPPQFSCSLFWLLVFLITCCHIFLISSSWTGIIN